MSMLAGMGVALMGLLMQPLAEASSCKAPAPYEYIAKAPCGLDVELHLAAIGKCNHMAKQTPPTDAEKQALALDMNLLGCDRLVTMKHALLVAHESGKDVVAGIVTDYLKAKNLQENFPPQAYAASMINCSVEEPFAFKSELNCPAEVQNYMVRVGECSQFAGEEAFSDARANELRRQVDAMQCNHLPEFFAHLKEKYKDKPLVRKVMSNFHQTHLLPYPGE